jgi:hypothetical protein
MPITGYISIGLPIGPNAESDPVFVTDPKYGLGGLRTIQTTADRDSIVDARRQQGMIAYVSEVDTYYSLIGGTGNGNWKVFNSGLTSYISSVNGKTGNVTISSGRGILVNNTSVIEINNDWGELEDARETLGSIIVVGFNGLTSGNVNLISGTDIGLTTGGNTITISYAGNAASVSNVVTSLGGLTGDLSFPIATTGPSAGIASFDSNYFDVSLTAHVMIKTGIKTGNLIILKESDIFGVGGTGALPELDGSKLLQVNAKLLDGKTREQITDGGFF